MTKAGRDSGNSDENTPSVATRVDTLAGRVADLDAAIKRMATCFRYFREKYEAHLKQQMIDAEYRRDLRRKIMTSAVMSGLAAVTLFFLGVLALGLRGWIREWLGG